MQFLLCRRLVLLLAAFRAVLYVVTAGAALRPRFVAELAKRGQNVPSSLATSRTRSVYATWSLILAARYFGTSIILDLTSSRSSRFVSRPLPKSLSVPERFSYAEDSTFDVCYYVKAYQKSNIRKAVLLTRGNTDIGKCSDKQVPDRLKFFVADERNSSRLSSQIRT